MPTHKSHSHTLTGIPGSVEFKEGKSGSPVVVLKHACGASAEVGRKGFYFTRARLSVVTWDLWVVPGRSSGCALPLQRSRTPYAPRQSHHRMLNS